MSSLKNPKLEDNEFFQKLQKRWEEINRKEIKDENDQPLKMDLEKFIELCAYKDAENLKGRSALMIPNLSSGKKKDQRVFARKMIWQMYMFCQINPEEYLLDTKEEYDHAKKNGDPTKAQKWLKKYDKDPNLYFTWDYWKKLKPFVSNGNPHVWFTIIPTISPSSGIGELRSLYENLASNYYTKAKKSIEVHETLFKGNNKNPGYFLAYREAQKEIFNAIDDVLEKYKGSGTFSYRRVFQLGPSESLHQRPTSPESKLIRFVMEASLETLLHVNEHLDPKKFPNGCCEFYVAPFSKFESQCLIDDKYFITEGYKRVLNDEDSFVIPHSLRVETVNVESDIQKQRTEFDIDLGLMSGKGLKTGVILINKEAFDKAIIDGKKYLDREIKKRDAAIETLEIMKHANSKDSSRQEKNLERLKQQEEYAKYILMKQKVRFNLKNDEIKPDQ